MSAALSVINVIVYLAVLASPLLLVRKYGRAGILYAGILSAGIVCARQLLGWVVSGGTTFFGPVEILLLYGPVFTVLFSLYALMLWGMLHLYRWYRRGR